VAWKTISIEIGRKYDLDEPNQDLWIKAIPMMWLPGSQSTDIISRINADEAKVREIGEDGEEAIKIRMAGLYDIFPALVASWNLKNDDQDMPIPSKLEDMSFVRSLPVQIIQEVCDACINYGVETEPDNAVALVAANDPDAGDAAAQAIPLAKDGESEPLSLVAAGQAEPSSSNGNSYS
jgi:hypothetical protein